MWLYCILIAVVSADNKISPAQMFVVDQTRSQQIESNVANTQIAQNPRLNVAPAPVGLSQPCADNFTCNSIPNAYCSATNKTCQCLHNFIEDTIFPGTCRLAPGYNELCALGEVECRQPFVCNSSSMCDCPSGFIQEYFQCIKDCPPGQIPINDDCYQARYLNEKCSRNEQCVQTYAQCLRNKCQCIQGATQVNGTCNPVIQCPVGNVLKNKKGNLLHCDNKEDANDTCPHDYYCMQIESAYKSGFCCPKLKMNCPIGQALDGRDCTDCPWETHHCFSYVIGGFTDTMCCPNACPTSHPIQKGGKCYARAAFGGHCDIDEQCYNVLAALCRSNAEYNSTTCQCPVGNYKFYFGRCLKDSTLGESCSGNDECRQGTNTRCVHGVCSCYETFIPEPSKTSAKSPPPRKCIAEPSCPTVNGLKALQQYTECTDNPDICKTDEFCRQWWFDVNHTYALCCPRPTLEDYQSICKPFNLKLSMELSGKSIKKCDIAPIPELMANDALNETETPRHCPVGISCLFDPFTVNKGICCEPDVPVEPSIDVTVQTTTETPIIVTESEAVTTTTELHTPSTTTTTTTTTTATSTRPSTSVKHHRTTTSSPKESKRGLNSSNNSNIPVIRVKSKKTN